MAARRAARAVPVLVLAWLLAACGAGDDSAAWQPKSGRALTEPKQVRSKNGVLRVNLDAGPRTIDVSGSRLRARPFNRQIDGPTLRVRPGDTIEVTFKNRTAENTNIHYHGLHVSPLGESDNVFREFKPGQTSQSVVKLPANHEVGTFWYHVHPHGISEPQVMGGLSGLLIVEGMEDTLPPELRQIKQRQLALRELQVSGNAIVLDPTKIIPSKPTHRLVNGQLNPKITIARGESQLWRIANIGTNVFYDISLPGYAFTVFAEDGNPVFAGKVRTREKLELPPGKRFDVVVQGRARGTFRLQTTDESGQTFPLAQVSVTGPGRTPRPDPTTNVPPPDDGSRQDLSSAPVTRTREFTFDFGPCTKDPTKVCGLVNGKDFDPMRLDVFVRVDTVEEWRILNQTPDAHPFHIHVNEFQVMSVNGTPYDAASLQDVVAVPPKVGDRPGEVVVRNNFQEFTGWFVFHCHILQHEDAGMMASIQVASAGEPERPPPNEMTAGPTPTHGS